MDAIDFREVGRQAYLAGDETGAPWLSTIVREAVGDMPVGTGAAAIFEAYRAGWLTALLDALTSPRFDESNPTTWNEPLPHGYAWREVAPGAAELHLYAPDGRDLTAMADAQPREATDR
jgi:hypothetical protein